MAEQGLKPSLMSGGRPGRGVRRVAVVVMAVVLSVAIAACGSSNGSSGSSGSAGSSAASGSSGSASGGSADVAAAKAAIEAYTGHPSAFPVDEPLSKELPAGTKFAYLQCGAQACAVAGKLLESAVKAIRGSLTVINAGTSASTAQAAASTALSLKPQVVFTTGIDPSMYGGGLKKLSDAGVKVISISVAEDVSKYGIDFNYQGAATYQLAGKLLADWVIANVGPKANIAFYGVPEITFTPYMQKAFEDEIAKNCPSCTVRTVSVGIATLGTTAPRTVVTDLQAHPGTNTAVFDSGNIAAGVPAALKAANLSPKTITFSPQAVNLQDIKSGGLTAGLAIDYGVSLWTPVDAAARMLLGGQPTQSELDGEATLQILEQKDITFDPTNGWSGYPDYAQRYAKLWHLS